MRVTERATPLTDIRTAKAFSLNFGEFSGIIDPSGRKLCLRERTVGPERLREFDSLQGPQ
jgi:hypothetical protein